MFSAVNGLLVVQVPLGCLYLIVHVCWVSTGDDDYELGVYGATVGEVVPGQGKAG